MSDFDPRWGSAWRDPLPAAEGEVLQLIDNTLHELPYPMPVTVAFMRSERGGYVNADVRAVIDWSCGTNKGRLRCDWRGQGAIVASRIRVSLETFRPNSEDPYSAAAVSAALGGRSSYACTVGIGAANPRLPLTFTTAFGNADTFQPPQAFSQRVRVLGYSKPEPTVSARSTHTTGAATATTYAPPLPAAQPGDLLLGLIASGASSAPSGFAGWTSLDPGSWNVHSRFVYKVATGADTIEATTAAAVHWRSRWWTIKNAGDAPSIVSTAQDLNAAPPWSGSLTLGATAANHRHLVIQGMAMSNFDYVPTAGAPDFTDFTVLGSPVSCGIATQEKMAAVTTINPDDFVLGNGVPAFRSFIVGVKAKTVPLTPTLIRQYSSFPVVNNGVFLGHYDLRAMQGSQSHPLHPLPDRVMRPTTYSLATGTWILSPQYVAVQYELGC